MRSRARKTSTTRRPTRRRAENRFLLRYYRPRLFDLEQCELPQAVLDKLPKVETHEHDPIEAAERIIAAMPTRRRFSTRLKAFYSPITDRITLPPRELFASAEEYYATALHDRRARSSEAPCARRHLRSRSVRFRGLLKRRIVRGNGSRLPLRAEAGISTAVIENQAAYVAGWLQNFRDNRRLLVDAAAHAACSRLHPR